MSIQQHKDLGCQASQVITINEDKITCTRSQLQKFWNYLGIELENVNGKVTSFIQHECKGNMKKKKLTIY